MDVQVLVVAHRSCLTVVKSFQAQTSHDATLEHSPAGFNRCSSIASLCSLSRLHQGCPVYEQCMQHQVVAFTTSGGSSGHFDL